MDFFPPFSSFFFSFWPGLGRDGRREWGRAWPFFLSPDNVPLRTYIYLKFCISPCQPPSGTPSSPSWFVSHPGPCGRPSRLAAGAWPLVFLPSPGQLDPCPVWPPPPPCLITQLSVQPLGLLVPHRPIPTPPSCFPPATVGWEPPQVPGDLLSCPPRRHDSTVTQ